MKRLMTAIGAIGLATMSALPAMAYSGEQFAVCNLDPKGDYFLAFRTCGSTKCEMIVKLRPGTFLLSLEPWSEKGWREVLIQAHIDDFDLDGLHGWVYDKYICRLDYP